METKGKRMAGKKERKAQDRVRRSKKRRPVANILIITIGIMLLYSLIYGILILIAMNTIGKMSYEKINVDNIEVNTNLFEEVADNVSKSEFESIKNVALFGIDGGRSDAIIIASLNQTDKSIKLISIPRDTYVKVDGYGKTKINHAYAYGKEELALKTINSNFGLNITEYITINFRGLINIINKIGGVEINITKAEMNYINQTSAEEYSISRKPIQRVKSYGNVTLTGEQALTHARNRTIGDDFKREERQRDVIEAVMNKVSNMGLSKILSLSDSILSEVKTNLNISECMGIITDAFGNRSQYLSNIISKQIPSDEKGNGSGNGQIINEVYYFVVDIEETSNALKNTIYGD